MKLTLGKPNSGIALIMVLLVMVAFGILAGRFSYLMKVETTLARNASFYPELEWIGRSGIEQARYVLSQGMIGPGAMVDALNQKWAGGLGDTNSILAMLPMQDVELGGGKFSLKITDLDRKFNINVANPFLLRQALNMVGVDASLTGTIVDSIVDWRDDNPGTEMSGAESDDYLALPNPGNPPYRAKNGPFDDITELLLVRGVTPAMFWGSSANTYASTFAAVRPASQSRFDEPVYQVGLVDIFTTMSSRFLNINTASATALQVIPAIDENIAAEIVRIRSGPDGFEGNEDDTPFRSPNELFAFIPAFDPAITAQIGQILSVKSEVFEARVDVQAGDMRREYVAIIRRTNPRDVQVLSMYWR